MFVVIKKEKKKQIKNIKKVENRSAGEQKKTNKTKKEKITLLINKIIYQITLSNLFIPIAVKNI